MKSMRPIVVTLSMAALPWAAAASVLTERTRQVTLIQDM